MGKWLRGGAGPGLASLVLAAYGPAARARGAGAAEASPIKVHRVGTADDSRARRTRRLGVFMPVLVVSVFVGFASDGGAAVARSGPSGPAIASALAAWAHFPVQGAHRPLVLIGNDNVNAPEFGFPDDETKLAFEDGTFSGPVTYPQGVVSRDGYPLTSAETALATMRAERTKGPPASAPLVVTSVDLGTGAFQTDRGVRLLPAWLFHFRGVQNPAQVLAIAPSRIFTPPARRSFSSTDLQTSAPVGAVSLASDNRSLTVRTGGAPEGTGPCTASYLLHVGASKTAVALQVRVVQHNPTSGIGCALPAYTVQLTAKLAAPLGNRVVVDALSHTAVPVAPAIQTAAP